MSDQVRATEAWTRSYDPALAVRRGQSVVVNQEDDEWPGWFWCVDAAGTGGWLPRHCLDGVEGRVRALEDFDTVELTIAPGELLTRLHTRDAWAWCRNGTNEEGRVPERVLIPA